MAEYIDKERLKQYFPANICGGSAYNELIDMQPPADVIERSEYQKLKNKNTELEIMSDDFLRMNEVLKKENTRLHEKIDKAIEEIEKLKEYGAKFEDGFEIHVNKADVLAILDKLIAESEEK